MSTVETGKREYDAIDLFAGSGWGVAASRLGIRELGVENMPEAVKTRRAAGMETLDVSVASLPDDFCASADRQIASPPCQTFSTAGKGAGRTALTEVLARLRHLVRTGELVRAGGDPRTWLVLEPLRLALGGRPRFIVWEQVPTVLPVWKAAETALQGVGYRTRCEIVNAEQHGVPQTRRRALMVARLDAGPLWPDITHSRFHVKSPARLDPDVKPWVSIAEALNIGPGFVGFPRLADRPEGRVSLGGTEYRGRDLRATDLPALTITEKVRSWQRWEFHNGPQTRVAKRTLDQPAGTVFTQRTANMRWVYRASNQEHAARRPLDKPAPTVMFGERVNKVEWMPEDLASDVSARGIPITTEEAAILQTFPADHPFRGSATKQFLQIGNAMPPVLAGAFLALSL